MKVEIKKNGFIYLDGNRSNEVDIKNIIYSNIFNDIDVLWESETDDENTNINVICGCNIMKVINLSGYTEKYKSVMKWKTDIQDLIDKINDWYLSLPVDCEEVTFTGNIIL